MVIKGLRLWLKSRRSGTNLSETWNLEAGKDTLHRSQVTSASHCSVDKLLKWITEICYKTLFGILLIPHHEESLHLCHKLIVMTRVASDIQSRVGGTPAVASLLWNPYWLMNLLIHWLTDWLTLWMVQNCVTDWVFDWLTDWVTVWLVDWLRGCKVFWSRHPTLEKHVAVTIEIVCHSQVVKTSFCLRFSIIFSSLLMYSSCLSCFEAFTCFSPN